MNNITILDDPEGIDLSRHGVIEAHAGTGKTYTIVRMVLRILQQRIDSTDDTSRRIHIRDILLVTFTDKAAGELRTRIREGLAERIAGLRTGQTAEPELVAHLEGCLNNLHEALLGTMHGVCLRLLQTWPFETGVPFVTEVVDDMQGLQAALHESIRTDWQEEERGIPRLLREMRSRGVCLKEQHFDLICAIALKRLDKEGTSLNRSSTGGADGAQLRALLDNAPGDYPVRRNFAAALRQIIETMNSIIKDPQGCFNPAILGELSRRTELWERQLISGVYDCASFTDLKKFGDGKLINTASTRKHPLFGILKDFHDTVSDDPFLRVLRGETLLLTLCGDAAEYLSDRWNRRKREQGLVSFTDMLRLLHRAVAGNPQFRNALRMRLHFGIIDEFQDTSLMQWDVFKQIFLDSAAGPGPRMFIVGDPKQSIYSFQGADVQSYLEAKAAVVAGNGVVYGLVNNYRSLSAMIQGYNSVFACDPDWFGFSGSGGTGISYPSAGAGGMLAASPVRDSAPRYPLPCAAVQTVVLTGGAHKRRCDMAQQTCSTIRTLRGTVVSLPKGSGWVDQRLDYKDFAVIVESHSLAGVFLDQLHDAGIPAVKYRLEGVFQSPMARDLHALLRAVVHRDGDPAPRLALLLTHFFNREPSRIDPQRDLDPCSRAGECARGESCLAHALAEWMYLADRRQWSLLFRSIGERTGIRRRLARLSDGQRSLADLRQVTDYCIETLYSGAGTLQDLVDHLGRLYTAQESAGRDQNLHMLATEKSSVKVLTMHASKGLEFPVVFVVTGGSKEPFKGPGTAEWIDAVHKRQVVPYLSTAELDVRTTGEEQSPREMMLLQADRERRRLLYVALTRAQAVLCVPMHLGSIAADTAGEVRWGDCPLASKNPDRELTPRLQAVLDAGNPALSLHKTAEVCSSESDTSSGGSAAAVQISLEPVPDIRSLDLPGRICRQTSYSQLSRRSSSHDRVIDRSEEAGEAAPHTASLPRRLPDLPGGAKTGDALHLMLESLLTSDNLAALARDEGHLRRLAEEFLSRNGILSAMGDPLRRARAIDTAVALIGRALLFPLPLPGGSAAVIADLPPDGRRAEMEFLLSRHPHFITGFMDLVFRIPNTSAVHPWRYFVLDWKSDQLSVYDREQVEQCIQNRHYELQAKLYCHALDLHLNGILGAAYDPPQNLGGAVYVFLRSFDSQLAEGACHTWFRSADPAGDAEFTRQCIEVLK